MKAGMPFSHMQSLSALPSPSHCPASPAYGSLSKFNRGLAKRQSEKIVHNNFNLSGNKLVSLRGGRTVQDTPQDCNLRWGGGWGSNRRREADIFLTPTCSLSAAQLQHVTPSNPSTMFCQSLCPNQLIILSLAKRTNKQLAFSFASKMELLHDKIKAAMSQFAALGNSYTPFIITLYKTIASHLNHFTVLQRVYFESIIFKFSIHAANCYCTLTTRRQYSCICYNPFHNQLSSYIRT